MSKVTEVNGVDQMLTGLLPGLLPEAPPILMSNGEAIKSTTMKLTDVPCLHVLRITATTAESMAIGLESVTIQTSELSKTSLMKGGGGGKSGGKVEAMVVASNLVLVAMTSEVARAAPVW
jgi:hypothetical protein